MCDAHEQCHARQVVDVMRGMEAVDASILCPVGRLGGRQDQASSAYMTTVEYIGFKNEIGEHFP